METTRLHIYVCQRVFAREDGSIIKTEEFIEAVPELPGNDNRICRRNRDELIAHIGRHGGYPDRDGKRAGKIESAFKLHGADITLPWRIIGRE